MFAPRPVTALTSYIPFSHCFGLNVVIDGMAAIAKRSCRPFEIVGRIKRRPPICSVLDEVWPPDLMGYVPLGREWIIISAHALEVALFPFAPVHEGDVFFRKGNERVGLC